MNPKLSAIKANIMTLYREDPSVVNDDATSFDRYWHRFDSWDDTKSPFWNLTMVTNPETLTRRRRELANAKLIVYSPKATKRRTSAFISERDLHSTHNAAIYVGLDRKK